MHFRAVVFLALATVGSSVFAQTAVDYGMGVNSATGALRSTCVAFARPVTTVAALQDDNLSGGPVEMEVVDSASAGFPGKSFEYDYKTIETFENLRDSLEISASSSLRGLWGSGSVSVDYLKTTVIDQYSLTMLVKARILGDPVAIAATADPSLLTSGGKKLSNAEVFRKCGDSFISALQYGGSINGILIVNTRSKEERERLRGELSGSFKSGLEVDAKAQRTIEYILRNNSYSIKYFQEGGSGSVGFPSRTGIEGFFDWARDTEKLIFANPTVMRVETKPLTSVYPKLKLPSAATQIDVLRRLAKLLLDARGREKNLTFISRQTHRFPTAKPNDILSNHQSVIDLINETNFLAEDCYRDEKLCVKKSVASLDATWKLINTPLPPEDPVYGVFDFASFDPQWRGFRRNGGCDVWWEWRLLLGDIEITANNTRLGYYFTCQRRGSCYKCNGGPNDCNQPDERPSWTGKVTADLKVVGDQVEIRNVISPNSLEGAGCEAPLVQFVKIKDGAKVKP